MARRAVALVALLWAVAGCRFDAGGLSGVQLDGASSMLDSGDAAHVPDGGADAAVDVLVVRLASDALPEAAPDHGVPDAAGDGHVDGATDGGALGDGAPADARPARDSARPPLDSRTTTDQGASSCKSQYGSAKGYKLCSEESKRCRFYVETGGSSCRQLCRRFGGKCLEAYDNLLLTKCVPFSWSDCNRRLGAQICVCSR